MKMIKFGSLITKMSSVFVEVIFLFLIINHFFISFDGKNSLRFIIVSLFLLYLSVCSIVVEYEEATEYKISLFEKTWLVFISPVLFFISLIFLIYFNAFISVEYTTIVNGNVIFLWLALILLNGKTRSIYEDKQNDLSRLYDGVNHD